MEFKMNKFIASVLVLGLSSCATTPATAAASVPSFTGYDSPECVFTMEGGEDEVRAFVIKKLESEANKNQKMLLDDISFQDVLTSGQEIYCRGQSVPKALEWIGL